MNNRRKGRCVMGKGVKNRRRNGLAECVRNQFFGGRGTANVQKNNGRRNIG